MDVLIEYWPNLLTVYVACAIAFTSPGPNFIAIAAYAVGNRQSGLGVAFGISVGTAVWALLASTGITIILLSYDSFAPVVAVAGGAYLIWLGIKSFRSVIARSKVNTSLNEVKSVKSFAKAIYIGLAIQLSNPKTALFWLALTSVTVKADSTLPVIVTIFLVLGCFILALMWHFFLALVLSSQYLGQKYIKSKPIFSSVFAVLFVFFGLKIIFDIAQELL